MIGHKVIVSMITTKNTLETFCRSQEHADHSTTMARRYIQENQEDVEMLETIPVLPTARPMSAKRGIQGSMDDARTPKRQTPGDRQAIQQR